MTTNERLVEIPTCVVPIELMVMALNVLHEVREETNNSALLSDCSFLERQIEGILVHYNLSGEVVSE